MRDFLPMVCPEISDDGLDYNSNDYDSSLDLQKMRAGLIPGDYAACILHNMAEVRRVMQYGQKTPVHPSMSWSTLVEHAQAYGLANAWGPDDAELVVETLLEKGAAVAGYWTADLVEWPFDGDRCLLAWARLVVQQHMLRKCATKDERQPAETNGHTCSQIGRWFARRPHLMVLASEPIVRLVQYVETLESMPQNVFEQYLQKVHSNQVMYCEDIRHPSTLAHLPATLARRLSTVLEHPPNREWSEQGFRSFALGFSWELRHQGNAAAFERVNATLNRTIQWTDPDLLALCMQDPVWLDNVLDHAVATSERSLGDIVRMPKNVGMERLYPHMLGGAENEQVPRIVAIAKHQPEWGFAIYKLTLAAALHEHFSAIHSSAYTELTRLEMTSSLLDVMDPHARAGLFKEMVLYIDGMRRMDETRNYKIQDPWSSFSEMLLWAWSSVHNKDDESHTALAMLIEWLSRWEHSFEQDLQMYSVIAGNCACVGAWLAESVDNTSNAPIQDDTTIVLHDLFDFTMDDNAASCAVVPGAALIRASHRPEAAPSANVQHGSLSVDGLF